MGLPLVSMSESYTVDGTTTSKTFQFDRPVGATSAKLKFGNITGLTGTLDVSEDGTNFFPIASVTDAGIVYAKGATITCVDGMSLYFYVAGWKYVRFSRAAGSGPFRVVEMEYSDEFIVAMLQALTSGSGFAVDTELPTAAALADNTANPTAPAVASFPHMWDGAAWDRVIGNSTDGLTVNLGANNDVVPLASLRPVSVTFSLDTSIYAAGDVLADTQLVSGAFRANDAKGWLVAAHLLDEDDNTVHAIDLWILKANVSIGTENAAISISDANAREVVGVIPIASTDWKDFINSKSVSIGNKPGSMLSMPVQAVSGTDDLAVALVNIDGTPTQTASGITGTLWLVDAQ